MSSLVESAAITENLEDLKSIAYDVLKKAQQLDASQAEVDIGVGSGLSVTVRLNEIETIEHNRDKGLGITVYFNKRKGSASTTDFSHKALSDTVAAACSIAKFTAEDECSGLADQALMAKDYPALDLFHPWNIHAEQAIEVAKECETAARELDSRITNSEGASVVSQQGARVYGNSHGFMGAYVTSRQSVSCSVIGQDKGTMQRDYWYTVARDQHDLDSAKSVGLQAAKRTLSRLNARSIATCQAPILYSADIASGLISHFLGAISGGSLYRKTSFLLDSLGQQIFSKFVHIHEVPHLTKALGSVPFDGEGVATYSKDFVKDGVVQAYVLNSYSSRKLDMKTTGNAGGVHNLLVTPGEHNFNELVKMMNKGLIITELMGMGVNGVTGDYSRGASGFWVEQGEIQFPVEEVTVAGNLKEMYLGIQAIGNDVDLRSNIRTGSILIDRMTIAGK